MRLKTLLLIISLFPVFLCAQNARSILDKAADAYNKAGGIKASFVLEAKDPSSKVSHSYDGTALMKGDKFRIDIPDAITWFDGTTQWVYMKDNEEVSVTTPEGDELQGISPAYLFNVYKKGFVLTNKGEVREGGKTKIRIEMTPEKKKADIKNILVDIDKETNMFSTIKIVDKSGLENSLRVVKMSTGLSLADNTFTFNKADYPDVEMVDLR